MLPMPWTPYTRGMEEHRTLLPGALTAFMLTAWMLAACTLAGCGASVAPSFDDPTPEARIGALERAAASNDRSSVPRCVENLSADDAAVRMAAAAALRRITGETLGYRFDAPAADRAAAIERWREWVTAHPDDAAEKKR